jgi:hypothetical protein
VTWVRLPTGTVATVEAVRKLLGAGYGDPAVGSAAKDTSNQTTITDLPDSLPERAQAALAKVTLDRSADTMRIIDACHGAA